MTTVQIVAIAVASLAALLLVIALIVTRRRGDDHSAEAEPTGSFLDEAPQDTLSGLGKVEQPMEDVTLDPVLQKQVAARQAAASQEQRRERPPAPGGLGLDWGPDLSVRGLEHTPTSGVRAPDEHEVEVTAELRPDDGGATMATHASGVPPGEAPAIDAPGLEQPPGPEPGRAPAGEPAAGPAAVPHAGGRMAPLSDVIVTTSSKMVDLDDPEVRRMLTDLVTFEIDQAAEFRRQGQTIDAVLQLTEAEKVARALGMAETARRIREMTDQIRGDG